ncbi:MAG: sigma-70 family RNA polymerase sigma factor [Clostridia bacterium]|nr:sigma-70 family RNA polymerase sigma factor [Clostridia bacterium]
MEDERIIDLYWDRNQQAIVETSGKYGDMCFRIAENMLFDRLDAEECVNDTYLGVWNAIPPSRPKVFSSFIARITRNLAMKKLTFLNAKKRAANLSVALSELDTCVSGDLSEDEMLDKQALSECMEAFLRTLSPQSRRIFLCRYFLFESLEEISKRVRISESAVKSSLSRDRNKLKVFLENAGFCV